MSGGKDGSGGPGDPKGNAPPDQEEKEALGVAKLLVGLRLAAREQEAEMVALPAELLIPSSEHECERIVRAITETQSRSRASTPPSGVIPLSMKGARIAPPRRWLKWAAVVGPVAIAAGLILTVGTRSVRETQLPGYSLTLDGGLKDFRGAAPSPGVALVQRVGRDTEMVLVCRPDVSVQGPVVARLFLVRGDAAREVSARARTSVSGSLEIRFNPVKEGHATPGRWTLRVVVGRPDVVLALPARAAVAASAGPQRHWLNGELEVIND